MIFCSKKKLLQSKNLPQKDNHFPPRGNINSSEYLFVKKNATLAENTIVLWGGGLRQAAARGRVSEQD